MQGQGKEGVEGNLHVFATATTSVALGGFTKYISISA